MKSIILAHEVDFTGWRDAARSLALSGTPPEQVHFSVGAPDDLFATDPAIPDLAEADPPAGTFSVSRALLALAQTAIQARDPERFDLLYGLVWRAHRGEKRIAELVTDPAVQRAVRLAQAVRRDTHKMRAFVRFREVAEPDGARHVAWFEPDHFIVEANADFFVRRFATMLFSILTPYRSVHWTGTELRFGPGASASDVPDDDALERYWRAYFGAIFNPARLKPSAMTSEMPRKYWRNLPEAAAIPDLIRGAEARTRAMLDAVPTEPDQRRKDRTMPARADHTSPDPEAPAAALPDVAREAASCRRCALWEPATQLVFGEGPANARMMLVGEQPGDQEDLAGRPFVGPAGQMLDRALREAGIERSTVYVTNAVKHFKFEPRGRRRIHAKPDNTEIQACSVWLEQERRLVRPELLVMLGATAARAVLGRTVTIGRERSVPIALPSAYGDALGLVTVHPSYLLRLPDESARQREYAAFVADLRQAGTLLERS